MVELKEIYFASNLSDNVISYGMLEGRGIFLERCNNRRYILRLADEMKVFEVFRRNSYK